MYHVHPKTSRKQTTLQKVFQNEIGPYQGTCCTYKPYRLKNELAISFTNN